MFDSCIDLLECVTRAYVQYTLYFCKRKKKGSIALMKLLFYVVAILKEV